MRRRTFLSRTAGVSGLTVLGLTTAASYGRIIGSNDRINVALVGCGRRGGLVAERMLQTGRARVVALCDVWGEARGRAKTRLGLTTAFESSSIDETLEQSNIDAVLLATPDHLHEQQSIKVAASGRHLFLEKPIALHWGEEQRIRQAVREAGVVCQVGTQQRSGPMYEQVRDRYFADTKPLGDIAFVRSHWSDFAWQRRSPEARIKPDDLDWEAFLGPAEHRAFEWQRYDAWRHYMEYGGGLLSDLLNHWVDVAQWMMDDAQPVDAVASGGVLFLHDGRTNPDTAQATLRYQDWIFSFESSVMPLQTTRPAVVFIGTHGRLELSREGFIYEREDGHVVSESHDDDLDLAHAEDFLDAILGSREPNATIDIGVEGIRPAHLAVAAYRSGRRARLDHGTISIA